MRGRVMVKKRFQKPAPRFSAHSSRAGSRLAREAEVLR
jgi:hypothetical protein